MGQDLTISFSPLASNGRTLVGTISGGSGSGYGPSSGVSGISVNLTTNSLPVAVQQASAIISGSTITITLAGVILSGQTVTVDVATGSNLTDSSSNTAQGQTGVAVTNNSTVSGTTIAGSNSSLYFLGYWVPSSGSGHNFQLISGTNSRLDTVVTGTDCDIQLYGGQNYTLTVDGTPTSITAPASTTTWVWYSLFAGKSNTAHTVSVTGLAFDTDNTLRVVGSGVSSPTGYGPYYQISAAPLSTYSAIEGSPTTSSTSGYTASPLTWGEAGAGIRFKANVTDLWLWGFHSSDQLVVLQDGVALTPLTVDNSSVFDLFHVASGLSGTHEYEITYIGATNSGHGSLNFASGVMLGGGTGLVSLAHTARSGIASYGDSIVQQSQANCVTSCMQGDWWLSTRPLNYIEDRRGNAGQQVSTYLRDNTAQITSLSPAPVAAWLCGGVNDQISGVTIGAVGTPGTFTGDDYTMIANVVSGLPPHTPVFHRAILPNSSANSSNRSTYNTAIQTAVNAYVAANPGATVYYVPTDNWIISSGSTDLIDSVLHPNSSGYAKIANRQIPIHASLTGTAFTAPSTASGTAGSASPAITITLAGSATFTGDQTVTITSDNGTDVLTPSVGSPGTGNVTVTPTNGLTAFTYTVNRSTAGTSHLSYTVNTTVQAQWATPSSTAYAAATASSITLDVATVIAGSTGVTIHVTGVNTSFSGTPISASVGTITAQTVVDATHVTLTYSGPSSIGICTFTDTVSGATATIEITTTVSGVTIGTVSYPNASYTVSWSAVAGRSSYNVYRNTDGGSYSLYESGVTATSITDTPTSGHTYGYKITAVDSTGYEDPQSSPSSVNATPSAGGSGPGIIGG